MIVAGFGFTSRATTDSLRDALALASGGRAVDLLATARDKAPALAPLAQDMGLTVARIDQSDLSAQNTLTQSPRAQAERGTGSVAEASALAAAGPGARLLGPRVISTDRMASCALAEGQSQ